MKTYLIQRGSFEDRDYKEGIDAIVIFDYMGSSEYEWGALPKSLENIRIGISDYIYTDICVGDKQITVFCTKYQQPKIEQYLNELADGKMRLKEYASFDSYVNNKFPRTNKTDFWWDIQNDLMFWRKDTVFENKFKKAIANKPKKKQQNKSKMSKALDFILRK